MLRRDRHRALFRITAVTVALVLVAYTGNLANAAEDPEWPCVQRLVPNISGGMVWAGPPLDETGAWRNDSEISELAARLANRRVSLSEAESLIEIFATSRKEDRDQSLTLLFAGILDQTNHRRTEVIDGIKRYTRRQRALASRIESTLAEIDALPPNGTAEQESRRSGLIEQTNWDSRIYEEREKSLSYLCETPVLLEQHVFSLGRVIQGYLD